MGNRTFSGFLSVISGKLGVRLLGLLITPLLVRIIGPGSYGDFAFVLSISGVATILVHLGTSAGIRKFIAEDRALGRWKEQVFAFYFRVGMILAMSGAAILFLITLVVPVDRLFGGGFSQYLILLGMILVADQFVYVFRYTLMALRQERYSEPLTVFKKFVYGISGLSLAYVGFDVAGLLAGMIIASILTAVLAAYILRKYVSVSAVFRSVDQTFPRRELLTFNVYNTIFILLTASLYNVDILLLQPLAGSEEAGFYKAALVVAEFVWIVPIAIQTVFIHSASELWSENRYDSVTRLASKTARYTLSFTLLLVIGIAGLSRNFVGVYFGSEYIAASTPLLFLLPGVLGFAVARPIFAIGQGKGDLQILIYATGSAAVLNLVLNLLLIPAYGMIGAATATSIGYGSMLVLHIWSARKVGYDPVGDLRLGRIVASGIPTAIVVFGASWAIDSPIIALTVAPPVGLIVYAIASVKFGVVDKYELHFVESYLPTPMNRVYVTLIDRL